MLNFVSEFITVPSPPVVIVTLGERHEYMCNVSTNNGVFWRVNGSRLNVDIFPFDIVPTNNELADGGRVFVLTIGGRPEHNGTVIQCSTDLEGSVLTTPSVSFFIQGQLLELMIHLTNLRCHVFG